MIRSRKYKSNSHKSTHRSSHKHSHAQQHRHEKLRAKIVDEVKEMPFCVKTFSRSVLLCYVSFRQWFFLSFPNGFSGFFDRVTKRSKQMFLKPIFFVSFFDKMLFFALPSVQQSHVFAVFFLYYNLFRKNIFASPESDNSNEEKKRKITNNNSSNSNRNNWQNDKKNSLRLFSMRVANKHSYKFPPYTK